MSSSPLQQIANAAVDAVGLAISTGTPTSSSGRTGAMYDLENLAAASPIHFHPLGSQTMGGQSFLMLNNLSWGTATASTTQTGFFSAFAAHTNPTWVQVNAATGQVTGVSNNLTIPMDIANTSRTLTAAVSRGTDNLFNLFSINNPTLGNGIAVIQNWFNNQSTGSLLKMGEEIIPSVLGVGGELVNFTAGLNLAQDITPYLNVFGTGATTGFVYQARKLWSGIGRIGTSNHPSNASWEFYNSSGGWSTSVTEAGPVITNTGPLQSTGPLSFANALINRTMYTATGGRMGYTFVANVINTSGTMTSQIYSSLGGRPYQPVGSPIALGTSGTTYTGGTVQLQGHLGANTSMLNLTNDMGGVPYVVTTQLTAGSNHALQTTWNLLHIPRIF